VWASVHDSSFFLNLFILEERLLLRRSNSPFAEKKHEALRRLCQSIRFRLSSGQSIHFFSFPPALPGSGALSFSAPLRQSK